MGFVELNKLRTAESLGSHLWSKVCNACSCLYARLQRIVTISWLRRRTVSAALVNPTCCVRQAQDSVQMTWDKWLDTLSTAENAQQALSTLLVRSVAVYTRVCH